MKIISTLIFFFPIILLAQKPSDSLLLTLYNKALVHNFSDPTWQNLRNNNTILIRTELDTAKLINGDGKYKFEYFAKDDELENVVKKPYKKNFKLETFNLTYKTFGIDTIDVIINSRTFTALNRRSFYMALSCGGGYGYVPNARFIYDSNQKIWNYISNKDIIEEKIKRSKRK